MHVALLCPYPQEITGPLERAGDTWAAVDEPGEAAGADFVILYGHRTLVREPHLSRFAGRFINLHVSYLPWNRGSDPNFWSFLDRTPKGVSIHHVDKGLDTGAIIAQREVSLEGTLTTTYRQLRAEMARLFADSWPLIRIGAVDTHPQPEGGSYHRSGDKTTIWRSLPLGFDTPVADVEALGDILRRGGPPGRTA